MSPQRIGCDVLSGWCCAAATAILYRYWLLAPVLRFVSSASWWGIGIVSAALLGALFSWLALRLWISIPVAAGGLLSGGTWAVYATPNDIKASIAGAFWEQLQIAWKSEIAFVVALIVGQILTKYWLRGRA